VVVDSHWRDYAPLVAQLDPYELSLQFAASGREALQISQTERPDVWLIAAHLPDMTGLSLAEMLIDQGQVGHRVLVAETYHADQERAALQLGLTLYVSKPVTADLLDKLLARCQPPPRSLAPPVLSPSSNPASP